MLKLSCVPILISLFVVNADIILREGPKNQATLKPLSACCDIPELGNSKPLAECSNPKAPGPCKDVKCVFEKSGWVSGEVLNKDAYKAHLRKFSEQNPKWNIAVERAITDCVDKDIRQYLEEPCKAYDVFTCTGIAMLKKPLSACCDIPELGNSKPLAECSNPKAPGPCKDVKCVFEKSGWVSGEVLNKDAYKAHLRKFSEQNPKWNIAVERAITDCVDKDIRQYLEEPCKAYDVFTCTGIAMLKKPLSACCDIPELGNSKPLAECSNPKAPGPCKDVKCVFEKSGWVSGEVLNKDAYKAHLRKFSEQNPKWNIAVERAITDCVDKDIRQYLEEPCKAYDVFTCTGIAMLKALSRAGKEACQKIHPHKLFTSNCCRYPPMFGPETMEGCGIEPMKRDGPPPDNGPPKGPPPCDKHICIMKNIGVLDDDGEHIDRKKMEEVMKQYSEKYPKYKDMVRKTIEFCLEQELQGPPDVCEPIKMSSCIGMAAYMECQDWDESDKCMEIRKLITECKQQ